MLTRSIYEVLFEWRTTFIDDQPSVSGKLSASKVHGSCTYACDAYRYTSRALGFVASCNVRPRMGVQSIGYSWTAGWQGAMPHVLVMLSVFKAQASIQFRR